MSHSVQQVVAETPKGFKETIADVTITSTSGSETVTAAELGLTRVDDATAEIKTAVATDTVVDWSCTPLGTGGLTLTGWAVAGAGTGHSGSIVRIRARGY